MQCYLHVEGFLQENLQKTAYWTKKCGSLKNPVFFGNKQEKCLWEEVESWLK